MSENKGILKTIQEREYPDPRTLPPQPSWQQPIPQLTLSELIPKQYVSLTARIVFLRTSERQDSLGSKMVFSGILEDSSFKIPFVSHRITYPLIRNSVYKFHSAYIHEFEDKSLLLVATEHTKIESKNVEDYREFVFSFKPNFIPAWVNKGAALGNLGKYNEAIVCYDRAIKIEPNDAAVWLSKGSALGNLVDLFFIYSL